MELNISVTKEKPFNFLLKIEPMWAAIIAVVGILGITASVIMKAIMKREKNQL